MKNIKRRIFIIAPQYDSDTLGRRIEVAKKRGSKKHIFFLDIFCSCGNVF